VKGQVLNPSATARGRTRRSGHRASTTLPPAHEELTQVHAQVGLPGGSDRYGGCRMAPHPRAAGEQVESPRRSSSLKWEGRAPCPARNRGALTVRRELQGGAGCCHTGWGGVGSSPAGNRGGCGQACLDGSKAADEWDLNELDALQQLRHVPRTVRPRKKSAWRDPPVGLLGTTGTRSLSRTVTPIAKNESSEPFFHPLERASQRKAGEVSRQAASCTSAGSFGR